MSGLSFSPEAFKRIRTERGVSQAKLSAATGTNRIAISRYETGRMVPTVATLAVMARALDASMDDFVEVAA